MAEPTPRTDEHLSHLNLPGGRKLGIPNETVALMRSIEQENAALTRQLREAEANERAIRELMNMHNLGGWTDALGPMKRALEAEARAEGMPTFRAFWEKHALGSMKQPSCLRCGHAKPFTVKHMELPNIGLCADCSLAAAPGAEGPDLLEAAKEIVRLEDQYRPEPAPHEWAKAGDNLRAAIKRRE